MEWIPKNTAGKMLFSKIEEILQGKVIAANENWIKVIDEHGKSLNLPVYQKKIEVEIYGKRLEIDVGYQNTYGSVLVICNNGKWLIRMEFYNNGIDFELNPSLSNLLPALQYLLKNVRRNRWYVVREDLEEYVRRICKVIIGYYARKN